MQQTDKRAWLLKTQLHNNKRVERQWKRAKTDTQVKKHTHKLQIQEEQKWCQHVHKQQLVLRFWQIRTKQGEIAETGRSGNACWIFYMNMFLLACWECKMCYWCMTVHKKINHQFQYVIFSVCTVHVSMGLVLGRVLGCLSPQYPHIRSLSMFSDF